MLSKATGAGVGKASVMDRGEMRLQCLTVGEAIRAGTGGTQQHHSRDLGSKMLE